jgi:transcription initiation factor TFIIA large subunit
MQTLGSQFGQKAAGSINAIHSGMTQQATQLSQPGGMPQGMQAGGQANMPMNPAYRAQLLAQQQRAAHQAALNAVPNGIAKSQVDGGVDEDDQAFDGVLLQRASNGSTSELGRVQIDSMLHEQIARGAKRMEGGGLMLPLREATKHKGIAKRERKSSGVAQHDGPEDDALVKDEDDDADAINSDLDDPEDNMDDDEDDDDAMGHIMLCTWDKVQRVKNKWYVSLETR